MLAERTRGEVGHGVCTGAVPLGADEALDMLESLSAVLARVDPGQLPDDVVARGLRVLEHADAVQAAVRGRFLQAFDARNIHLADGHLRRDPVPHRPAGPGRPG